MQTVSIPQTLDYREARKRLWGILQLRAASIAIHEAREFDWIFDEDQKQTIRGLIQYFINDPECPWPLHKGLYVFGMPGTGKTEIMRALSRFTIEAGIQKKFQVSSFSEIYTEAKTSTNREHDPIGDNLKFNRCFDEFGRYVGAVNRFGNTIDIAETLVELRYERFQRYGQITHFIANATPAETADLVTPMVFDRIRSMCTSIEFPGQSKRK